MKKQKPKTKKQKKQKPMELEIVQPVAPKDADSHEAVELIELEPAPAESKSAHSFDPRALIQSKYWRLNNLYKIINKQGKLVTFKMNSVQRAIYQEKHPLKVCLKSRQHGVSTMKAIEYLDILLHEPNCTIGYIDKTLDDAKEKINKIKLAYDELGQSDEPIAKEYGKLIKKSVIITSNTTLELQFNNGSKIKAGTSLRGATLQYLHISEYGSVCCHNPVKASEILSGSINTVGTGQEIFIESTHEGGKSGHFYDICERAMKHEPRNELDWKFLFYSWMDDSTCVANAEFVKIEESTQKYIDELAEKLDYHFTPEQQSWYQSKKNTLGDLIFQEYPSEPSEAWHQSTDGSIYLDLLIRAHKESRLKEFSFFPDRPVYCFWDIGWKDPTAIWAAQFVDNTLYFIDYYENNQQPPSHYVQLIEQWKHLGYNIATNFLPHDAFNHDKTGITYHQQLRMCGMNNIKKVPKTQDRWLGINKLRELLKTAYINTGKCGRGLECLEAYRKGFNQRLQCFGDPLHDWSSNGSDAARYCAEAIMNNLVKSDGMQTQKPLTVTYGKKILGQYNMVPRNYYPTR